MDVTLQGLGSFSAESRKWRAKLWQQEMQFDLLRIGVRALSLRLSCGASPAARSIAAWCGTGPSCCPRQASRRGAGVGDPGAVAESDTQTTSSLATSLPGTLRTHLTVREIFKLEIHPGNIRGLEGVGQKVYSKTHTVQGREEPEGPPCHDIVLHRYHDHLHSRWTGGRSRIVQDRRPPSPRRS